MKRILVSDIVAMVAAHYCMEPSAVTGPSRKRKFVRPRWVALVLAHEFCYDYRFGDWAPISCMKMGRLFSRDHSTILNSYRRAEYLQATAPKFRADMQMFRLKVATELATREPARELQAHELSAPL